MYSTIKEQFSQVIQYSQNIPEPELDDLFDDWAKAKAKFIKSVVIGESVVLINKKAFLGCIPNSVEFQNASGWVVSYFNTKEISRNDLLDKNKATTYLCSTYDDYVWTRS